MIKNVIIICLMIVVVICSALYYSTAKSNADLLVHLDLTNSDKDNFAQVQYSYTVVDSNRKEIVNKNIVDSIAGNITTRFGTKDVDGINYHIFELKSSISDEQIVFLFRKLPSNVFEVYIDSDHTIDLKCSALNQYVICDYSKEDMFYPSGVFGAGNFHLLIRPK